MRSDVLGLSGVAGIDPRNNKTIAMRERALSADDEFK